MPLGHLIRAASQIRKPINYIAQRLRELGCNVPQYDTSDKAGLVSYNDKILISRNLDSMPPWLVDEVSLEHVLVAVARLKQPIVEISRRLRELGYHLMFNVDRLGSGWPLRDDLILLSAGLDGSPPWLGVYMGEDGLTKSTLALPRHAVTAALQTGRELNEVVSRLAFLGVQVAGSGDDWTNLSIGVKDRIMLSVHLNGRSPWVPQVINVVHVLRAAKQLRQPVRLICDRFEELLYDVPKFSERLPRSRPGRLL